MVKPAQPGCGSTSVMTVTPVQKCLRRSGSRTVLTGKASIHRCLRWLPGDVRIRQNNGSRVYGSCPEKSPRRVGELYAIEAEIRGCTAEQRLAARKARAAPLMQSLYDWIQTQMKTLSRHSDTVKAFAYLLKQWDALNVYCSNGWVEIDNNIAENALRGVAVGRKNWLFAGSDSGGEHAAVLYSLIGTCRLNNVEPEKWLRYVIEHIQDWPANRVRDLLPWKVDLTAQ